MGNLKWGVQEFEVDNVSQCLSNAFWFVCFRILEATTPTIVVQIKLTDSDIAHQEGESMIVIVQIEFKT